MHAFLSFFSRFSPVPYTLHLTSYCGFYEVYLVTYFVLFSCVTRVATTNPRVLSGVSPS